MFFFYVKLYEHDGFFSRNFAYILIWLECQRSSCTPPRNKKLEEAPTPPLLTSRRQFRLKEAILNIRTLITSTY